MKRFKKRWGRLFSIMSHIRRSKGSPGDMVGDGQFYPEDEKKHVTHQKTNPVEAARRAGF